MRRRAFTLIELLIVIGILVGVVGVAMLSLADFRREAEFRAVADRMESIGELARAEALRHDKPVELLLREPATVGRDRGRGSRQMRVLTRRLDPIESAESIDGGEGEPPRARIRTELPRWVVIAKDDTEGDALGREATTEDIRLAVFLNDGSALGARAVTLEDTRSGAQMRFSVDALLGVSETVIDWSPTPIEGERVEVSRGTGVDS